MWWLCVYLLTTLAPDVKADNSSAPLSTPNSGRPTLWNATWTDHLKHDLLMKYDKFARPAQHTNATEVTFGLVIKHIEVDEVKSMMVINAWTRFQWKDEKLTWNATDYAGLTKLTVADHEVWQPDIVLYNSAVGNSVDHYGNTHCIVWMDGKVLWVPPSQFSVYCDINLRKWPYDQHTCYFFFGSWVYDGEQIKLKRAPDNSTLEGHADLDPCEWAVVSIKEVEHTKYYSCCSEPYLNIEIVITVQRRSPANACIFFTPAFVCVLLTLVVFWLPPNASEKFLISGVTALILSMFLTYFAQRLPTLATHTPLIVVFYAYNLLLVCMSVVVSVVTVSLSRKPRPRPLPWVITRLLNSQAAAFLALPTPKNLVLRQDCEELHERSLVDRGRTESDATVSQPSLASCSHDWVVLATALDRLMFLLYLAIFLFLSSAFYLS